MLPEISATGFGLFAIIYGIFIFVVHVIMALAVNGDAKDLLWKDRELFLFGPFVWGGIVFIFGLAGLALYWAVHHSTLRTSAPPDAR